MKMHSLHSCKIIGALKRAKAIHKGIKIYLTYYQETDSSESEFFPFLFALDHQATSTECNLRGKLAALSRQFSKRVYLRLFRHINQARKLQ